MKKLIFTFSLFASCQSFSQYIGVKAKYTETMLVDNLPLPPSRENRLILSFYEVSPAGVWTPTVLSGYDIWVEKAGLQYGSELGGVLDSIGNNYPGYSFTSPRVVSYYNTLGVNYFDCNPNYMTHFVVNGHELDCGFVRVSTWEWNESSQRENEFFNAPNVGLPYYFLPSIYYSLPGNVNFGFPCCAGAPYNWYNFSCGASLQLVIRGVMSSETGNFEQPLPVRFAFVRGDIDDNSSVTISWSNMTESDIERYIIERGDDSIGSVNPTINNGGRANYSFQTVQSEIAANYRIKAIEKDGRIRYSPVIRLTRDIPSVYPGKENNLLRIHPNPVPGTAFTFTVNNAEKGRYISSIVTPDGKQVKQKMIVHQGGDLLRQVETAGLLPGIYRLVIRSAGYRYSQTFIVGY